MTSSHDIMRSQCDVLISPQDISEKIIKMQLDVEVSPPAFIRNLSKDMVPFVKAIPQSNFG